MTWRSATGERSAVRPPSRGSPPSTCTISPVVAGKKSDSSAHTAFAVGVWSVVVPAERGPGAPHVLEVLEAGDRLGGQRLERAGGDQVAADALGAEVAGEVARGGLQGRLGHAHPVVRRPGDGGVEGQPDDRAARDPSAAGRRWSATSGSTPRPAPPGPRPATGRRGTCRRAASRGCRRRSSARRRRARRRARGPASARPREVLLVGDVELEHRRLGREPLGDPPGDAERAAEVGDEHGGALLLRDLRGREADRGVHRHAGDQDPLAVENARIMSVPHSESAVDRDDGPGDVRRAVARPASVTAAATSSGDGVAAQRHLRLDRRPSARR